MFRLSLSSLDQCKSCSNSFHSSSEVCECFQVVDEFARADEFCATGNNLARFSLHDISNHTQFSERQSTNHKHNISISFVMRRTSGSLRKLLRELVANQLSLDFAGSASRTTANTSRWRHHWRHRNHARIIVETELIGNQFSQQFSKRRSISHTRIFVVFVVWIDRPASAPQTSVNWKKKKRTNFNENITFRKNVFSPITNKTLTPGTPS